MKSCFMWTIIALFALFQPATAQAAPGDGVWTANIGDGSDEAIGTPLLADGVLVAATKFLGLFGLKASDGTQVWHNATIPHFPGERMLWRGNVYMGASDHLYKISPSTGVIVVDRALAGRTVSGWATPTAAGDLVFFVTENSSPGQYDYRLHGADATTLADVWTTPLQNRASLMTDGATLYVLSNTLKSIDPLTGLQRWEIAPADGWYMFTNGALHDGKLVAYATHEAAPWGFEVACYDVGDGRVDPSGPKWRDNHDNRTYHNLATPVIDGDRVLAMVGSNLRAYDLATGTQAWTVALGVNATPIALDGKIYVMNHVEGSGSNLSVSCLDGATGGNLWSKPITQIVGQPIVVGGKVFAQDYNSVLRAFQTAPHAHAWPMNNGDAGQTSSSTTLATSSWQGAGHALTPLLLLD